MDILQFISGHEVIELLSVDSTNNYAANLFKHGNPAEGTVILSQEQTHGRGQRGTVWQSHAGKDLTFSLLLRPNFLPLEHQFKLSQSVSLAIRDYLEEVTNKAVTIKWPNDILVNGTKIAGILIENGISGQHLDWSTVGIGLNLNQARFESFRATSMLLVTGNEFEPKTSLAQLLKHLDRRYEELKSLRYKLIEDDYQASLLNFNVAARYKINQEIVEGTIVGTTSRGLLRLETNAGEREFDLKELEFILD
jgi:BirA family transcriptional regulator, biotin operon repressor / biotin---[acetyl-CoA-carboxylase] ligase